MIQYRPIATIHNAEDITSYFPSSTLKGDEANIVVNAFLNGDIHARKIDVWEEECFRDIQDIVSDTDTLFTGDGKYAVRFQRGDASMLRLGEYAHGFYIDIYKMVDYAEKNIDVHGNLACDFAKFMASAILASTENTNSSNDTGIMIEMPDGEVVPVSYAWYDRQRDMIRISFEEEN